MERLDKALSGTGRWSRREVKELVRRGRVLLDGVPAASPEQKIDPETADIRVDGEIVSYRRFTYVLLHKPAGVLSAVEDSRQRTVLDLLPQELRRQGLSPVGRLDKDTEGLLLLTNDGALTHRLLSPKSHVDKVYYARTEGTPTEADADPVAGLVEVPCVKRNVVGAVNAVSSSQMASAGIKSRIPVDEVIDAMAYVGDKMDESLKETGVGGLAGTVSGKEIAGRVL